MEFLKFNDKKELEFMFMKHHAPTDGEPSTEALNFRGGGGGGGIRAYVNIEVKFLWNLKKKYFFFFFLGGGGGGGGGGGPVRGWGGDQGRCERRSEVFVKIQKKKKIRRGGGGGQM